VRAAQQATHTIAIVAIVDDIVASGLINSLAKPGGNTTGVSILSSELDAKRLEILKQIVPSGWRFAVLRDPASASARMELLNDAARHLGLELRVVDVRSPTDFAPAFASFRPGEAHAVNILSAPLLFGFRSELCGLSMTYKVPAIGQAREMAEAGCLASYGISFSEFYSTAAKLTDKLLKGARPEETPAEQPTKFELVINLKTAKALGLTVPPSILDRADEVIE
jgi:putative ABC transport system substrate-binding protein